MSLVHEDDQIYLTESRWKKGHCETGRDLLNCGDLKYCTLNYLNHARNKKWIKNNLPKKLCLVMKLIIFLAKQSLLNLLLLVKTLLGILTSLFLARSKTLSLVSADKSSICSSAMWLLVSLSDWSVWPLSSLITCLRLVSSISRWITEVHWLRYPSTAL